MYYDNEVEFKNLIEYGMYSNILDLTLVVSCLYSDGHLCDSKLPYIVLLNHCTSVSPRAVQTVYCLCITCLHCLHCITFTFCALHVLHDFFLWLPLYTLLLYYYYN